MLSLQIEKVDGVLREVRPLLKDHYEEIANYKEDVKLNPDIDQYRLLEERDELVVYTARWNGKLAGYCVVFVRPHIHYKDDLYGSIDITYLAPEHRGKMIGVKLFKYVENDLKERGVSVVIQHTKTSHNFGPMLERMGYTQTEIIYSKCIKGE